MGNVSHNCENKKDWKARNLNQNYWEYLAGQATSYGDISGQRSFVRTERRQESCAAAGRMGGQGVSDKLKAGNIGFKLQTRLSGQ